MFERLNLLCSAREACHGRGLGHNCSTLMIGMTLECLIKWKFRIPTCVMQLQQSGFKKIHNASNSTLATHVNASKSEKGSILGGLSEVTRMIPGATIKGTAGLEIDFSNTWRYLKYLLNLLGQRHRDTPIQPLLAHLSKLIRWWCWPPAFPQPPGCLRCLPIRPWPFAKQPCKACIDRILKELHKMWLSSRFFK